MILYFLTPIRPKGLAVVFQTFSPCFSLQFFGHFPSIFDDGVQALRAESDAFEKFSPFFISRSEEDFLDYEEGGLRLEAVAFSAQTAPKIAGGGPPPLPTGGIVVQAAALTPSLLYFLPP